jgi:hypothetical protein
MTLVAGQEARRCYAHPQESANTQCKLCGLAMCDRCYEHIVAGAPACGRCTHEAATRSQRAVSLAISMLGLGAAGFLWAHRAGHLAAMGALLAGAAVLLLTSLVYFLVRRGSNIEIEARDRELELATEPDARVAHPYRQMARHVALHLSPKVSAGAVTLALGASMVASAVLFPAALKLPRWAELEVVMAAWWALVTLVLSTLLYRGYRLKDDWTFTSALRPLWASDPPSPTKAARAEERPVESSSSPAKRWLSGCDLGCSGVTDEGFLVVIGVIVAAVLLFGAGWVLVEIALPMVLFAAYTGILAALKRVAHDRHGCEGDLARALPWGALWAALYVLPLATLVWLVHLFGGST